MTVSGKDTRFVLLLSSLLIVIPMVIFPARLGISLGAGYFTYALFEIVYYGIVFYIFRPGSSLLHLFQGAGLTFLYRIVIGTVFGIIISLMYSVNFTAALTLGVSRYFPAIILHIAAAPLITKPFYLAVIGESDGGRAARRRQPRTETRESITSQPFFPAEEERRRTVPQQVAHDMNEEAVAEKRINGFERAVRYVGGHQAVKLAVVVDFEGLTMATFKRGEIDPDTWAPLALLLRNVNKDIIARHNKVDDTDRMDLTYRQEKLFILHSAGYDLLVLSNREDDDLLSIRLTQAAEMIKKYVTERYGKLSPIIREEKYVRST